MITGKHLSRLSSLGTGLLLGTALGVIIPEYVEGLSIGVHDAFKLLRTS